MPCRNCAANFNASSSVCAPPFSLRRHAQHQLRVQIQAELVGQSHVFEQRRRNVLGQHRASGRAAMRGRTLARHVARVARPARAPSTCTPRASSSRSQQRRGVFRRLRARPPPAAAAARRAAACRSARKTRDSGSRESRSCGFRAGRAWSPRRCAPDRGPDRGSR